MPVGVCQDKSEAAALVRLPFIQVNREPRWFPATSRGSIEGHKRTRPASKAVRIGVLTAPVNNLCQVPRGPDPDC
jgi:hypothetical protein